MAKQSEFLSFFHKIEWLCMVLRILNREGHQNSMIRSKVTTILTTLMRALLPRKFISSQGRYCPKSSFQNISVLDSSLQMLLKKFGQRVELVGGGSVINGAYHVQFQSEKDGDVFNMPAIKKLVISAPCMTLNFWLKYYHFNPPSKKMFS